MTNIGHTAAGYLISQVKLKKDQSEFKKSEIIVILVSANIFDFDYLLLPLGGIPGWLHHYSPSHTPLFGLVYLLLIYYLFRKRFQPLTFVYCGLAMLSHLVLDDISYWLSFIQLTSDTHPQIFWLYPFDPRFNAEVRWAFEQLYSRAWSFGVIVEYYLVHTPLVVLIELIIVITTGIKFFRRKIINFPLKQI